MLASTGGLLEAKLRRPFARPGIVDRAALVQRLSHSGVPVVVIMAPAGYGKTTLLGQWADRDPRPFAWLSIDEQDDAVALAAYLAAALERLTVGRPSVARRSPVRRAPARVVLMRASTMWSKPSFVLALDDLHKLEDRDGFELIAALVPHIPPGSALALACRREPPIGVPRLRGSGQILEIGVGDLALDTAQGRLLLEGEGVEVSEGELQKLHERTEGWPVALYLSAQWLKAGGSQNGGSFTGDDRVIADFQRLELLAHVPKREVTFMIRTSVLDEMSGPLCDAVLRTGGSTDTLEHLERSDLPLTPLGRNREWYRYHRLFRDLLRAELERRESRRVPAFLRRASGWSDRHGRPEEAIRYAQAAGDADRVNRLVAIHTLPFYARGRVAPVEGWFDWLDQHAGPGSYAPTSALGVWFHAMRGRPAEAERWAGAIERTSFDGTAPDGSASLEPWLATIRALLCRDGPERMLEDAGLAVAMLGAQSPWRTQALLLRGLAHLIAGDAETADDVLADAAEESEVGDVPYTAIGALSERALMAAESADWADAAAMIERARSLRSQFGVDYVTSALAGAVGARVAWHRGDLATARGELARAHRLRPLLSYATPHLSVQTLLELARVHIALADATGARTLLRECHLILRRRPNLGTLAEGAKEVSRLVEEIKSGVPGASSITNAELRLLSYLPTHLSFREIGERLHVSPHTVKTQAISIYRKFGVTSRSGAIERAVHLGLLEPSAS